MTKNIKKLLIVLGILVVVAIIVIVLPKFKKSSGSALVSKSVTTNNTINIPTNSPDPSREFVSLLQSIKSITLDPTLIQSKAFQKLVNYGTILPENAPFGRPNPFAVIGDDSQIIKQTESSSSSPEKENKNTQPEKGIDSSIYEIDSLLNGL